MTRSNRKREALAAARIARGLTVEALAAAAGVHRGQVVRWESLGQYPKRAETRRLVSDALGVPESAVFEAESRPTAQPKPAPAVSEEAVALSPGRGMSNGQPRERAVTASGRDLFESAETRRLERLQIATQLLGGLLANGADRTSGDAATQMVATALALADELIRQSHLPHGGTRS